MGFQNIIDGKGISVSIIGFFTVLFTLLILGYIVGKLPLLVKAQEKSASMLFGRRKKNNASQAVTPAEAPEKPAIDYSFDAKALDKVYRELAVALGDSFNLADLYALARERDLEHPYLSVNALRDAGVIVPAADNKETGLFIYKPMTI